MGSINKVIFAASLSFAALASGSASATFVDPWPKAPAANDAPVFSAADAAALEGIAQQALNGGGLAAPAPAPVPVPVPVQISQSASRSLDNFIGNLQANDWPQAKKDMFFGNFFSQVGGGVNSIADLQAQGFSKVAPVPLPAPEPFVFEPVPVAAPEPFVFQPVPVAAPQPVILPAPVQRPLVQAAFDPVPVPRAFAQPAARAPIALAANNAPVNVAAASGAQGGQVPVPGPLSFLIAAAGAFFLRRKPA